MRYMLLIYRDETVWDEMPDQEKGELRQEVGDFIEGLRARGVYRGGDPLHSVRTATTVRVKGGKATTTDGPFAETKEQLGGYMILEAENLDEAIAIAARNPLVRRGGLSIEVRPIMDWPPPP
jgi:hypothetical protein